MRPWLSELFLGSQSDERLVSLAHAGHDRAFVAIVERHKRQLVALARRLGPENRAEDVVQQAFLSAFAALQGGAEVQHVRGWLHQIVRNAAINAAARAPSESELGEDVLAADSPEDEVARRLLARSTLAEVARLPERQRDALVKTAVQGRSRSEVALSMGLSEGAVRQLVHRARASLRTAVSAITPYPLAAGAAGARPASGVNRMAEITFGAGSASAGGLALKAGAVVVATSVLATGIVVSPSRHHLPHRTHQMRAGTEVTAAGAQAQRGSTAAPDGAGGALASGQRGSRQAASSIAYLSTATSSSRLAAAGGHTTGRFGGGSGNRGGGDSAGLGNAGSGATNGSNGGENSPIGGSSTGGSWTSGSSTSGDGGATTTTSTDAADTSPAAPPPTPTAGKDTTTTTNGD